MNIIHSHRTLTKDALSKLVRKEAAVLRVENFFHRDACDRIAGQLLQSSLYGRYVNAPQVGRIGRAFFETIVSRESFVEYFGQASEWMRHLRDCCEPDQTPVDKLRLELDECWQPGAALARLAGLPMYAGLIRVFETGAFAEPHQDHLDWDAAHHEVYRDSYYPVQIAANVYLHMPDAGGELAIWPVSLPRTEYEARRNPGSYGVNVSGFGEPIVLTPRKGELILFDARNIHRVDAPQAGRRVSASCFIGYRNDETPLSIWS